MKSYINEIAMISRRWDVGDPAPVCSDRRGQSRGIDRELRVNMSSTVDFFSRGDKQKWVLEKETRTYICLEMIHFNKSMRGILPILKLKIAFGQLTF